MSSINFTFISISEFCFFFPYIKLFENGSGEQFSPQIWRIRQCYFRSGMGYKIIRGGIFVFDISTPISKGLDTMNCPKKYDPNVLSNVCVTWILKVQIFQKIWYVSSLELPSQYYTH